MMQHGLFFFSSSFSRVPYKYGSERASEKRELLAERHTSSSSSSSSRYIYFGFVTFAEDGQHSTPTDKRAATNCCRDRAPQQTGDGWGIISCREIWISALYAQPSTALHPAYLQPAALLSTQPDVPMAKFF
jgi:hypothetical protein